jgi:hypothetical protein
MKDSFDVKKEEIRKNRKIIKERYEKQIKREKKEILKDISRSDRKSGLWFQKLILKVLKTHSKNVNAEYFQKKYGTATKDIIAKKLITSYLNYNTAIGVVIGGAGGFGELIIAIFTTFPEIALVTFNQLKMIYDLSVIYGDPVNMDDPEEAFSVLLIAFGVRVSEIFKEGAIFAIDRGGKIIVKRYGKRVVLRKLQQAILKALCKKVTQKSIKTIIAKAPPIIGAISGAIVCGATDYFSTKAVADKTLYRFRTGKLIIEYFWAHDRIYENVKMSWIFHWLFKKKEEAKYIYYSQVLSKGCWIMVNSDSKIDQNKTQLIDFIYSTKPLGEEFIYSLKERVKIPVEEFLNDFNHIKCRNKNKELEIKKTIFYAMELIAVSDKKISKEEISILEKIAPSFNINQDELRKELENLKNDLFNL